MGEQEGAVLSAVLLGEKGGMDPELKELYQKNGIGHILAISGLHISFLGLGLYHLIRKAGGSFLVSGIAAMGVLGLYVLMIGPGVSSIRALIMLLIRVAADLAGRVYDMATSIAVAAVCIVIVRPLNLYDAGFLLSFGAVAGIAVVQPYLSLIFHSRSERKGVMKMITEGFCAGISIHLVILPVMMYYFFEFPVWSFLLNLAVIPLMSVLLTLAALGSVASLLFLPAGVVLFQGCSIILKFYELLCRGTMKIPFGRIVTGKPGVVQLILYYLGLSAILFLGILLDRKKRAEEKVAAGKKLRAGIAFLMLGMSFVCMTGHGKSGEVTAVVLDVGQGDGIYVRGPEGTKYLFDGGSSDVKSVGTYRIEPFLKSQKTGTLDYVFISHGDADHMNGIEEMLGRQEFGVRIRHIVLPLQKFWDDTLQRIAMQIECLFPGEEFEGEIGNESSLVFQVSYQKFRMLLTGDVEGKGEEVLTDSEELSECTVLKVAHHGSKNSTDKEFLSRAKPEYAVISAGRDNRYGHPHKELIERLQDVKCTILQTPLSGAVRIWTDGKEMTVETYQK